MKSESGFGVDPANSSGASIRGNGYARIAGGGGYHDGKWGGDDLYVNEEMSMILGEIDEFDTLSS